MAFDGFVVSNIVHEMQSVLKGGRITKIAQPEPDALILTIKATGSQFKLLLSASASLPLLYLTDDSRPSPITAPNFCMLLRKHLNSARILSVTQPGLERIVRIEIEHLDELGDLQHKYLIIELMGKHSNIIFCDDKNNIVDSIKRISGLVSSVREVLPGRPYFIPETSEKLDPLSVSADAFASCIFSKPVPCAEALYKSLTGFSPCMAQELCFLASVDADQPANALAEAEQLHLYRNFTRLMDRVRNADYQPVILYRKKEPAEFSCFPLTFLETMLAGQDSIKSFDSISLLLETYYGERDTLSRIRQKSSDLRKALNNLLERSRKKADLQRRQLKDTEKRDKYRIYGELINTYGYGLPEASASLTALNYYTNEEITIPLDKELTPAENAKKYFDRYNKLKRTFEAVSTQLAETLAELSHLESISTSLDIALKEEDLYQLKEELIVSGYMRRKNAPSKGKNAKKPRFTSKPFHYISSDGFHIYVGKNNYQNDELTFQTAAQGDWWFHAKNMPGSHVIVKTEGKELSDRTFEEAGRLAAYYSKGRGADKIEIDYTEKRNVKKPAGAKPGFVVYYTNYSLLIDSDISEIELIES